MKKGGRRHQRVRRAQHGREGRGSVGEDKVGKGAHEYADLDEVVARTGSEKDQSQLTACREDRTPGKGGGAVLPANGGRE